MAEHRDQVSAEPRAAELDDTQLLGFEWLEPKREVGARTEQAIGIAFNKRGLSGEGPTLKSPPAG
jgi:hypothetical protein